MPSTKSMIVTVRFVEWVSWSVWSRCDVTCGQGRQDRRRKCDGQGCLGTVRETRSCTERNCPSKQIKIYSFPKDIGKTSASQTYKTRLSRDSNLICDSCFLHTYISYIQFALRPPEYPICTMTSRNELKYLGDIMAIPVIFALYLKGQIEQF